MFPLKPIAISILTPASILALAFSLQAGDVPENTTPVSREQVTAQKAMVQEIQDFLADSQREVSALNEKLSSVVHEREAALLQAKIGEIKHRVDIRVLEIQLRYARLEGRAHTVSRLEAALAKTREIASDSRSSDGLIPREPQ